MGGVPLPCQMVGFVVLSMLDGCVGHASTQLDGFGRETVESASEMTPRPHRVGIGGWLGLIRMIY